MSNSYDERRERCMLDQSSSVGTPLHVILRSFAELKTRYADTHPDIEELIQSFNALAAAEDSPDTRAERERLAERTDVLRRNYADRRMTELAQWLGNAGVCLRGEYPLHPVRALPSLRIES